MKVYVYLVIIFSKVHPINPLKAHFQNFFSLSWLLYTSNNINVLVYYLEILLVFLNNVPVEYIDV